MNASIISIKWISLSVLTGLIVILSAQSVVSQTRDVITHELTWQSSTSQELHSGQTVNTSFTVVTHKDESIDLVFDGNKLSFAIDRIEGEWNDYDIDGAIEYTVSYQEKHGKVRIERVGKQITILIDFTSEVADGMKRKFIIDKISN